jgi:hypothetical protein
MNLQDCNFFIDMLNYTEQSDIFQNLSIPHMDDACKLGFFGIGSHFGIEIEIETYFSYEQKESFIKDFFKSGLNKYYLMTTDITLKNGFEFISAPMTLFYHQINIKKLCDWFKNYITYIYITEDTGIHIHIEKLNNNFTKIKQIIYNNKIEVDLISERKENKYCQRFKNTNNNKNNAIHETLNTFEIRIFKSSIYYDNIIRKLLWVNSCLE